MTIGPEPISRILWRSVRLGTHALQTPGAPPRDVEDTGQRLFLDEAIDDGGLRGRLVAAVEHVVEAARAEPEHLAVAPELLAEDAHPPVDALAHGVRLEGKVTGRREDRPVGLLPRVFRPPVRDQVLWHGVEPL